MFFKSVASATLLTGIGALTANASTVTTHEFDLSLPGGLLDGGHEGAFTSNSPNSFSLVSESGGVALEGTFTGSYVTGYAVDEDQIVSGGFSAATEIKRHNFGAGVCRDSAATSPNICANGEAHSVDGITDDVQDFIEMSFAVDGEAASVQLTELRFGWIGPVDWFTTQQGYFLESGAPSTGAFELITDTFGEDGIGAGDTQVRSGVVVPQQVPATIYEGLVGTVPLTDVSGDLVNDVFGVKAGEGGSWKLLSAIVQFTTSPPSGDPRKDDTPPPVIPLPATGWMLLGGLGGLAFMARRRRKD